MATHYVFKIDGFKPDTLPFGRLVEYYHELVKMLSGLDGVRLVGIWDGSHASAIWVDKTNQSEVAVRLKMVRSGAAPYQSARAKIDEMLAQDNTSAVLLDEFGANVLPFPGRSKELKPPIQLRDTASFVGELYHIAGNDDHAKVRLRTEDYGTIYGIATKQLAKKLRDFLFEPVKVSGRGLWRQADDAGLWEIEQFTITDFSPVRSETLRSAISKIREADISWPEDPLGDLARLDELDRPH